jgi:serine/threonine protein kinase
MERKRVLALIDGFNYYHKLALYQKNQNVCVKWLDYMSLLKSAIKSHLRTEDFNIEVIFFTAIATHRGIESQARHRLYLKALKTSGVKVILGEFKEKYIYPCKDCKQKHFDEKTTKIMAWKIAHIVEKLHKLCFSHRDLNIHNILVNQNYDLKLGSFGSAKYFLNQNGKSVLLFGRVGTPYYMPPEMNKKLYDGKKADIFSLGQLLFNLVTNLKGFEEASENDIYFSLIKNKKYEDYWKLEKFSNINISESFKQLYLKMVNFSPNERPSIDEILKDDWLKEINELNEEQMNTLEKEVKQEFKNREAKIKN